MSHDLDVYLPYDAGAGADILEDQWRAMARFFSTSGPIRGQLSDFLVTTTSGRNVTVSAGRCFINGQYGELSTSFTQAFTTNTSGNPRIDRVVLRNDFSANKIVVDVLVGTPGASPSPPALTQNTAMWEISLAQVTLPSGYTAIIASQILDERSFAQGRPPGGPLVAGCALNATTSGSGNSSVPNGTQTNITFDGADDYDTVAMHVAGEQRVTIPPGLAGLWACACRVRFLQNSTGSRQLLIQNGGVTVETHPSVAAAPITPGGVSAYGEYVFAAGDIITWQMYQSSGGTLDMASAHASYRYLGPVA